jgi:hypothetical protein
MKLRPQLRSFQCQTNQAAIVILKCYQGRSIVQLESGSLSGAKIIQDVMKYITVWN